jgi:hypothetical protein
MAASLSQSTARSTLYRTARWHVIFTLAVFLQSVLPPTLPAQVGHTAKPPKGPRALGLLELAPDGRAHLIPITILIDGKYYDASAYKAAPVPMALWSDTVYEAILTGISQGLFTVREPLQRKDEYGTTEWIAEGTWQTAAALKAKVKKKPSESTPRGINEDEGPPVLRRGGSEKPKPPEPSAAPTTAAHTQPAAPSEATPAPAPTASTSPSQREPSQDDKPPEDQDRPTLKRGKPPATSAPETQSPVPMPVAKTSAPTPSTAPASTATSPAASSAVPPASQVQLIPAISDAHSPDLIPYAYNMKPEEEEQFRKTMLAMAADEIRARTAQPASARAGASQKAHAALNSGKTVGGRLLQPIFDDVQLRVFDLGNVNEPELILTAKAHMPEHSPGKGTTTAAQSPNKLEYMITLVARGDINGDFHKGLVNITDTQHLDAIPRLDLIDAVDVNGDGRGELLFRQVSEAGSAFVVYSVIGDRLYPLFQGALGQ